MYLHPLERDFRINKTRKLIHILLAEVVQTFDCTFYGVNMRMLHRKSCIIERERDTLQLVTYDTWYKDELTFIPCVPQATVQPKK
jgi:hypothetical protein